MKQLLAWALLMGALVTPNLLYVTRTSFYGGFWDATQFVLFAFATLLLPFGFLPLRMALLLLLPFIILLPAALLHVSILGHPISKGMILSSVYSSPHEVTNALMMRLDISFFALLLLGLGLWSALSLFRSKADIPRRKKIGAACLGLALYILVSLPVDAGNTGTRIWQHPDWKLSLLLGNRAHGPFTDLYPFGFAARVGRVAKDMASLRNWREQRSRAAWNVSRPSPVSVPEVHVIVIGESSRRNHWQLYGYHRPTTPFISAETQVFPLTDVISPANVTIHAVTQLLSRASPENVERAYQEPSILVAFKKSGFKTFWLSNSEMIGKFSTPITMIANDADDTSFLSNIDPDSMDAVLLDESAKALKDPAEKKLIVLHMKGSHLPYRDRFTEAFDRFQPSQLGKDIVDWSQADRDETINTYDNSLLYTDAILGRLIQQLKEQPGHASLTFVSDHGELLMDHGSRDIGHPTAKGSREEFEVPFFIWLNAAYITAHPDRSAQLDKNRQVPASSLILFDSLLGLTGLQIEGHPAEKNIFSPDFRGTPRPVLLPNGEVRDYDRDIRTNP